MQKADQTRLVFWLALLLFPSGCIDTPANIEAGLLNLATALGVLMITIQGLRWLLSEQPEVRDDAKKAITYVLMALILAVTADMLVDAMYAY